MAWKKIRDFRYFSLRRKNERITAKRDPRETYTMQRSGNDAPRTSSDNGNFSILRDGFFKFPPARGERPDGGRYYTRIDVATPEKGVLQLECVDARELDDALPHLANFPHDVATAVSHSVLETSSSALHPVFAPWLPRLPYFSGYRPDAVLGNTLYRKHWSEQARQWRDSVANLRERDNWDLTHDVWRATMTDIGRELGISPTVGTQIPKWVEITVAPQAATAGQLPTLQYFGLFSPAAPRAITRIRPIKGQAADLLERYTSILDVALADQRMPDIDDILEATLSDRQIDRVSVYDVGQGNWNALLDHDGKVALHFDCGGGVLGNNRSFPHGLITNTCWSTNPPVVLSHWDWDHWSSAWRFREFLDLPWLVPYQKLGTIQAKLATYLYSKRKLAVWRGRSYGTWGQALIQQCTGHSINDSGLAISVSPPQGFGREILLPGDARYGYIPCTTWRSSFAGMVASHHGGNIRTAGGTMTRPPAPAVPGCSCALSYGTGNGYGHPADAMTNSYIDAGWKLIETATRPGGSPGTIGLHWGTPGTPIPTTCSLASCQAQPCTLNVHQF